MGVCNVQECRALAELKVPEATEAAVHEALEAIDSVAPGLPLVKEALHAVDELVARRLKRQQSRARCTITRMNVCVCAWSARWSDCVEHNAQGRFCTT